AASPLDHRVQRVVMHNTSVWLSAQTRCQPGGGGTPFYSCARLTELTAGGTALGQDFKYGITGKFFMYPAVTVDEVNFTGNLIFVAEMSSASDPLTVVAAGRRPTDPAGT